MDRVWNQSHQENSYETNYSIARDIIMEGREYAHEKDEETLGWYQNRYVHAINSDFNHIVNLMRYGEHERALDAIDPARERIVTLYDEERGNKPITVEQRQQSYSMLDEIIQKDREVVQISRENREEKIQKTIELLELWKTFFRDYPVTNGTHAGRFSMGRFFELLYYVDSDLRAYYFQGNEQARERAQNLIGNRLQPVLQNLTDPEHMTTDGIAREAGADLGRFWDVMTSYYENMSNYVQIMNERDRNQNREQQEQLQQEQIEIERNLEDQFVRLSEMYHAPHRAFKEPFHHKQTGEDWWFDQRLEQIRSLLNLGTR